MNNNIFGGFNINSATGQNFSKTTKTRTGDRQNINIFDKTGSPSAKKPEMELLSLTSRLYLATTRRDELLQKLDRLNNEKSNNKTPKFDLSDENLELMIPIAYLSEEIENLNNRLIEQ